MGHCILEGQGGDLTGYYFFYPGRYCGWMSDGTESSGSITHHRDSWESTKYAANCGAWVNSNFTIAAENFTKLHFKATVGNIRSTYRPEFGVWTSKVSSVSSSESAMHPYGYKFTAAECATGTIEHDIDITGATGNMYCYYSGVAIIEITEFWLE